MAFVPIRQVGAGGIVTDQAPYDLELQQFPAGNNVAIEDGKIGKALGYSNRKSLAFEPTHVQGWLYQGNNSLVIGANTAIYRFDGTNVTNVSSQTYSNSPRWQSAQIGAGVIMNNGTEVPEFMFPNGSAFAALTAWPTNVTTQCLKPFNSFLIMVGYEDLTNRYPYTVRWSDEYDPASVPQSWDITSTTNLAGENVLSGNNGELIDQLTLNDANIIYAERGVFAMTFIGAPLVFAFREIFNDDGIINRGAVAGFFGQHLVVGQNDIYVHDGNNKRSIVDKRVRRQFFAELRDTRSVFCQSIPDRSEVWICYADDDSSDSQTANRALVYNWAQDAFTFIDLPNIRALTLADKMDTSGDWDNSPVTWAQSSDYWSNASITTAGQNIKLFGAGYLDDKVYQHNDTYGADGSALDAFIEASKLDLDAITGGSTATIKQINQILPQIEGSGAVTIRVGVSDSPQQGVQWIAERSYNIESDHKIDVRASGRYLALRFQSASSENWWKVTGLDIDIREVAKR